MRNFRTIYRGSTAFISEGSLRGIAGEVFGRISFEIFDEILKEPMEND